MVGVDLADYFARTGKSTVMGAWSEILSAGEVFKSIMVRAYQGARASVRFSSL